MQTRKIVDLIRTYGHPAILFKYAKKIFTDRTALSAAICLCGYGGVALSGAGFGNTTHEIVAGVSMAILLGLAIRYKDPAMPFVAAAMIPVTMLRDAPQLMSLNKDSWVMLAIGTLGSIPMMSQRLKDSAWNRLVALEKAAPTGNITFFRKAGRQLYRALYKEFADPKLFYTLMWTGSHLMAVLPHYATMTTAKKYGLMATIVGNLVYVAADRPVRRAFHISTQWIKTKRHHSTSPDYIQDGFEILTPLPFWNASDNRKTLDTIMRYGPLAQPANDDHPTPPPVSGAYNKIAANRLPA